MLNRLITAMVVLCVAGGVLCTGPNAGAARKAVGTRDASGGTDYQAYKLLERGEDLLSSGEVDRGIRMVLTVIDQNPKSPIRYRGYLLLGKHYLEAHEYAKAIDNLRNLGSLKKGEEEMKPADEEMFLEGLYLMGVAHFNARQYGAAFSMLRKITAGYPNTVWANQAYYYIGMSHFAQRHWSKAIQNLSLVGTFIDPDSPEVQYVEAGHRFYVKIDDGDLPVLKRLGREIAVMVKAASGDSEKIVCTPRMDETTVFVGSVRTEVGKGKPGDGILNLVGGDSITVLYTDDSTREGKKNVEKKKVVKVVSTGALNFTRGTYTFKADSAFLEQPVYLRVKDVDLDKSEEADTVKIRLVSTYKVEEEDAELPTMTVDIDKLLNEKEEDKVKVRDEVTLTLAEIGDKPVHKGVLVGNVMITKADPEKEPNKTDAVFSCAVGDKIVATYIDEQTIKGAGAVEIVEDLTVFDELDSRPRADQDVVAEAIIKAKKEIVEAEAYLEIARIFQSMGLRKGAKEKADEGLDRVEFAIRTRAAIPPSLRERAFSIKWNLYLSQDDFGRAMGTCRSFNRLYPESPLVDNALMGIGDIHLKKKNYKDAIKVFSQIANMPNSHSRAQAQFRVAETMEKMNEGGRGAEAGIAAYKRCAQRFPDSEFAGPALAKVVDYHIKTKDFAEADDLLTQIFLDYQDEGFLDRMLLKWVLVSYDMGDYQKAHQKCKQLLFEYPGSEHARKAQNVLPRIEEKLSKKEG